MLDPSDASLTHVAQSLGLPQLYLRTDFSQLNTYLDSILLLVRCRNAAYRLSAEAWDSASRMILRIPRATQPSGCIGADRKCCPELDHGGADLSGQDTGD